MSMIWANGLGQGQDEPREGQIPLEAYTVLQQIKLPFTALSLSADHFPAPTSQVS